MAGVATEETGARRSFDGFSSAQEQQYQSGEALAEWRSSEQVENGTPSTSPPYWDSDDDDDGGLKPSELYGKYTWKIDKFSQINKRELRSNAFEVGGYKWYILIYPQGCDVCNHLSLFLCVANHDKLLPGWSHFAQFTIAVVNKDPKKSKYSDTLHRFWKKEHDWGWKKFMELSKVLDGFIDADTLIIKAQVQVIRERADRPFRCLDRQYRRELVRVYLTNVEQICRRFVEERRSKLGKLIEDKARWSSFCGFWMAMDQMSRRRISREKTESILKIVVKSFFIEKEVTSTLVMDSLYSGLKALEAQSNKGKRSKGKNLEAEELPVPIICIEKDTFVLVDDVLLLLERAAMEPLPPKDEKGPQNRTKDGAAGEEFNKDSIERDERRLTELGRRTIEIFVLAHIFSKIEVAYQEAVAYKRQEELIREEEAAWLAETEQKTKRQPADKEKKSKKKQGKQKKNNRKGKDKGKEDKLNGIVLDQVEQDNGIGEGSDFLADPELALEKSDALEDVSDVSDSIDCVSEILLPDSDDKDASPVNWDTDNSEIPPPTEASSCGISGLSVVHNEVEARSPSAVDDSSSTCSSDSVPSVTLNVSCKGTFRNHKNRKSQTSGRRHENKSETTAWPSGVHSQLYAAAVPEVEQTLDKYCNLSQNSAPHRSQDSVVNGNGRHVGKKEEEPGLSHKISSAKDDINVEIASIGSPSRSPSKSISSVAPKLEPKVNTLADPVTVKKLPPDGPRAAERSVRVSSSENVNSVKTDTQKLMTPRPSEKPSAQNLPAVTAERPSTTPLPVLSRPLSAPIVPGPRPTVSMVSVIQTAPMLSRSASATGRLAPEPTTSASQSYIPQSYRNAIIGGPVAAKSSSYNQNHPASSVINPSLSYSQTPPLVSAPMSSPHGSDRSDPNSAKTKFPFGVMNNHDVLQNRPMWMDSQRADCRNLPGDRAPLNDLKASALYSPVGSRSQDQHPSEFPAGTSGRQSHTFVDEFPHLGIINELLDDDYEIGKVSQCNLSYPSFENGPYHLNRQFSFPGDPGMSSGLGPSTSSHKFERTRSYLDDGFRHGYATSTSPFDTARDVVQASPQQYRNGQIDGLMASQWPMMGRSDLPFLNARNIDNTYHVPDYTNLAVGTNGYTVFRPSNGL